MKLAVGRGANRFALVPACPRRTDSCRDFGRPARPAPTALRRGVSCSGFTVISAVCARLGRRRERAHRLQHSHGRAPVIVNRTSKSNERLTTHIRNIRPGYFLRPSLTRNKEPGPGRAKARKVQSANSPKGRLGHEKAGFGSISFHHLLGAARPADHRLRGHAGAAKPPQPRPTWKSAWPTSRPT